MCVKRRCHTHSRRLDKINEQADTPHSGGQRHIILPPGEAKRESRHVPDPAGNRHLGLLLGGFFGFQPFRRWVRYDISPERLSFNSNTLTPIASTPFSAENATSPCASIKHLKRRFPPKMIPSLWTPMCETNCMLFASNITLPPLHPFHYREHSKPQLTVRIMIILRGPSISIPYTYTVQSAHSILQSPNNVIFKTKQLICSFNFAQRTQARTTRNQTRIHNRIQIVPSLYCTINYAPQPYHRKPGQIVILPV